MYRQIEGNKAKTNLLLTIFLVVVIGLGWVLARLYDAPGILIIAVIMSLTQALVSYYASDKIALAVSRARPLARRDELELFRVVENLAISAGIPMPALYLIDDSAPNAFATGRDPKHGTIAVTHGLISKLNKTELEGVMAHEVSHITNYDIRLSTLVVVLVGVMALASDWFLRSMWWGDRDRQEGSNPLFLLVGIVLALLAPLIATLIQLAISRKREFLADASGALLTRYPEGLARALEKIAKDKEPLEVANKATAHLYFENPLKDYRGRLNTLFSTHPAVAERVKALRAMI